MFFYDVYKKWRFCLDADRLGPDIPFTHWRLHFKKKMIKLCQKKFRKFDLTAEVRPGAYVVGCSQIEIGSRVIIRPGTMLFGETNEPMEVSIKIEDDVMLGAGIHIYVNNHKYGNRNLPLIYQGYFPDRAVTLKKGCWVGANAILLPGIEIGYNSIVAAGSVVTRVVPDNVIVAGVPAKILKNI